MVLFRITEAIGLTPESDFNGKLEYDFEGDDGIGGLFSFAGFFNISH